MPLIHANVLEHSKIPQRLVLWSGSQHWCCDKSVFLVVLVEQEGGHQGGCGEHGGELSWTICVGLKYTVTFVWLVVSPKHAVRMKIVDGPVCVFRCASSGVISRAMERDCRPLRDGLRGPREDCDGELPKLDSQLDAP